MSAPNSAEEDEEFFIVRYRGPSETRQVIFNYLTGESAGYYEYCDLLKSMRVGRAKTLGEFYSFLQAPFPTSERNLKSPVPEEHDSESVDDKDVDVETNKLLSESTPKRESVPVNVERKSGDGSPSEEIKKDGLPLCKDVTLAAVSALLERAAPIADYPHTRARKRRYSECDDDKSSMSEGESSGYSGRSSVSRTFFSSTDHPGNSNQPTNESFDESYLTSSSDSRPEETVRTEKTISNENWKLENADVEREEEI